MARGPPVSPLSTGGRRGAASLQSLTVQVAFPERICLARTCSLFPAPLFFPRWIPLPLTKNGHSSPESITAPECRGLLRCKMGW